MIIYLFLFEWNGSRCFPNFKQLLNFNNENNKQTNIITNYECPCLYLFTALSNEIDYKPIENNEWKTEFYENDIHKK